ncbi:MAG: cob(I)yrinic acid a,c-diamide adenosyltransferase [Thermomicrobiales bacterium]|nr:cob(I)yrinic acid a,c-diamide adenosyltransferase [Thermomicrobiales bacterium]
MKLYTGKGDQGQTDLLGDRTRKSDARIGLLGSLDEATSSIGLARSHAVTGEIRDLLVECQRDLYRIMADLAFTDDIRPAQYTLGEDRVAWLEEATDSLGAQVTLAPEFVIPGETVAGATADVARTVVRRAERDAVVLRDAGQPMNEQILRYLNRLSSLLFIVARASEAAEAATAPRAKAS